MWARDWTLGVALVAICGSGPSGCARPPVAAPTLAVVVSGGEGLQAAASAAVRNPGGLPVVARLAERPNAPPADDGTGQNAAAETIAQARRAYFEGSFAECLAALDDRSRVTALIGEERREVAARWRFWRVACQYGTTNTAAAAVEALEFATLGLEIPAVEAARAAPEVEVLIGRTSGEVGAAPRVAVTINAGAESATVGIDGRPGACRTPCTLNLVAGSHVLRLDADGFEPDVRVVPVAPPSMTLRIQLTPATPALASQQWRARFAASSEIESTASLRLLSQAVRTRRLALVTDERDARTVRLRGALLVDGAMVARVERQYSASRPLARDDVGALLIELLDRGRLSPTAGAVFRSPWFWLASSIAVAAVGAAGLIYWELAPPRVEVFVR